MLGFGLVFGIIFRLEFQVGFKFRFECRFVYRVRFWNMSRFRCVFRIGNLIIILLIGNIAIWTVTYMNRVVCGGIMFRLKFWIRKSIPSFDIAK